MPTPLSGGSPYCSADQFLARYDWREVGDYLSEDTARKTKSDIQASPDLAAMLAEASGVVESAAMSNGRYTPGDLGVLTGNSAQMLAGIVAGITMFFVWDRRAGRYAERKLPARAELAFEWLDKLKNGDAIFGIQEVADSGNPDVQFLDELDIETRNLASNQARRFFGDRAQYHVPGPS